MPISDKERDTVRDSLLKLLDDRNSSTAEKYYAIESLRNLPIVVESEDYYFDERQQEIESDSFETLNPMDILSAIEEFGEYK